MVAIPFLSLQESAIHARATKPKCTIVGTVGMSNSLFDPLSSLSSMIALRSGLHISGLSVIDKVVDALAATVYVLKRQPGDRSKTDTPSWDPLFCELRK